MRNAWGKLVLAPVDAVRLAQDRVRAEAEVVVASLAVGDRLRVEREVAER
jgi:hypothetical protein